MPGYADVTGTASFQRSCIELASLACLSGSLGNRCWIRYLIADQHHIIGGVERAPLHPIQARSHSCRKHLQLSRASSSGDGCSPIDHARAQLDCCDEVPLRLSVAFEGMARKKRSQASSKRGASDDSYDGAGSVHTADEITSVLFAVPEQNSKSISLFLGAVCSSLIVIECMQCSVITITQDLERSGITHRHSVLRLIHCHLVLRIVLHPAAIYNDAREISPHLKLLKD